MAFDINNPAHLIAVRDAEANDPDSVGFAAVRGDDKKTLKLFNEIENNPLGGTLTGQVFNHQILMETWIPKGALNEFIPWIEALTREQGDISQYEAKYRANCGSASLAALDAVVVPLNYVENLESKLIGYQTTLSVDDWTTCRDYTGV